MAFDDVPHMRAGAPSTQRRAETRQVGFWRRRAKGGIAGRLETSGIIAPTLAAANAGVPMTRRHIHG
jgi:hypothetical protein